MAENSKIQWTDHTFNPWRGCTKVSPGCKFCYAERGAGRNPSVLGKWGPAGTRVLASDTTWREPERWQRGSGLATPLVFCASLADVFEDWPGQMTVSRKNPIKWLPPLDVPLWRFPDTPPQGSPTSIPEQNPGCVPYRLADARYRLWWLIKQTPNLRWLLLTKRPENIRTMMPGGNWPNVWMGVSIENQEYAWRIDALNEAPQNFARKFISYEPALGPLTLWENLEGIDWVIMGGESGGEARECNVNWYRAMIAQCRAVGAYPFVKQMGKVAITGPAADDPTSRLALCLLSDPGHGGEMDDWPADLRIREIPPR